MTELTKVLEEVLRLERQGQPGVLVTLIEAGGSTPRHDVARMVVHADGNSVGTIGGGTLEHTMTQKALACLATGQPTLESTTLEQLGMPCGGQVKVLLEPLGLTPWLVIFGAGHVGQEVALAGERCGFNVAVVDNRPEFANESRFPGTRQLVHSFDPAQWSSLPWGTTTYAVVVTRDHEHDYAVVRALVERDLAYLGLMGSRKKVADARHRLAAEGVSADQIDRLHAPIGLDIASETPAEIAISILAEVISVRRGKEG
jgi:xanthine dehydrogenase accessory factor